MAHTTLFQKLIFPTALIIPLITTTQPSFAQTNVAQNNLTASIPNINSAKHSDRLGFEPKKPAPKRTKGGGRRLFEPPAGQAAPGATKGGGRRAAPLCGQDRKSQLGAPNSQESLPLNEQLAPVVPYDKESKNYLKGLTLAEHPTFLVNIPKTSARKLEFVLNKVESDEGFRMVLDLPKEPGVLRISLPPTLEPLEVNQDYVWKVTFVCQAGSTNPNVGDPFTGGVIRRVKLDSLAPVQPDKPMTLAEVEKYAQAGIWYDASAGLAALKHAQPDDPTLKATWQSLLEDGALEALSNTPVKN
jgi:hypothetical protein